MLAQTVLAAFDVGRVEAVVEATVGASKAGRRVSIVSGERDRHRGAVGLELPLALVSEDAREPHQRLALRAVAVEELQRVELDFGLQLRQIEHRRDIEVTRYAPGARDARAVSAARHEAQRPTLVPQIDLVRAWGPT